MPVPGKTPENQKNNGIMEATLVDSNPGRKSARQLKMEEQCVNNFYGAVKKYVPKNTELIMFYMKNVDRKNVASSLSFRLKDKSTVLGKDVIKDYGDVMYQLMTRGPIQLLDHGGTFGTKRKEVAIQIRPEDEMYRVTY